MEKHYSGTFAQVVNAVAKDLLAAPYRKDGVCLNGQSHNAVAGASGFAAVSPTEVAYRVADTAPSGRRWRNCNHDTVRSALLQAGWVEVRVNYKSFLLLDRAEASRLRDAAEAHRTAKTTARNASWAKAKAVRDAGPTAYLTIYYARKPGSFNTPKRGAYVSAAEVFDLAAKAAKGGKAVRITVSESSYAGSEKAWTWTRGPAATAAVALGASPKAVAEVTKLEG